MSLAQTLASYQAEEYSPLVWVVTAS